MMLNAEQTSTSNGLPPEYTQGNQYHQKLISLSLLCSSISKF